MVENLRRNWPIIVMVFLFVAVPALLLGGLGAFSQKAESTPSTTDNLVVVVESNLIRLERAAAQARKEGTLDAIGELQKAQLAVYQEYLNAGIPPTWGLPTSEELKMWASALTDFQAVTANEATFANTDESGIITIKDSSNQDETVARSYQGGTVVYGQHLVVINCQIWQLEKAERCPVEEVILRIPDGDNIYRQAISLNHLGLVVSSGYWPVEANKLFPD